MDLARWCRPVAAAVALLGASLTAQAAPPAPPVQRIPFEDLNDNGLMDPGERDISADLKNGLVESRFPLVLPVLVRRTGDLTITSEVKITSRADMSVTDGKLSMGTYEGGTILVTRGVIRANDVVLESGGLLQLGNNVAIHAKATVNVFGLNVAIGDRVRLTGNAPGGISVYVHGYHGLQAGKSLSAAAPGAIYLSTSDGDLTLADGADLRSRGRWDWQTGDWSDLGAGELWVISGQNLRAGRGHYQGNMRVTFYLADSGSEGPQNERYDLAVAPGSRLIVDRIGEITIWSYRKAPSIHITLARCTLQTPMSLAIWNADIDLSMCNITMPNSASDGCAVYFNSGVDNPKRSLDIRGTKFKNFGEDDYWTNDSEPTLQ